MTLMSRILILSYLRQKMRRLPLVTYQKLRVWKFEFLSDALNVVSLACHNQPVLMTGCGKIQLGKCNLGVWPSPLYLSGYIHIEARNPDAEIVIGDGVVISNNASIIAEQSRIEIGDNTLIGTEFMILDSDFHGIHPDNRVSGMHKAAPIIIGKNVFVAARVTVLKGVSIGDNSVIASGAVVTRDVPSNSIAAGIPARVIAKIPVSEINIENAVNYS